MSKKNNPLDQQLLQEEYEEIKFKLLMSRLAEQEGKMLEEINEELSKDPFYHPSEQAQRAFENRIRRQFLLLNFKKILRRLVPIRFQKIAVVLPLFFILLLTTFLSVEALRVRVLNLFIQMEGDHTAIRIGEDSPQISEHHLQIEWDNAFAPSKVPEGYHIANVTNNQTMKLIEYKNDDNDYILFQQNSDSSSMNVDTEDADEVTAINIQGKEGLVVQKNDLITVVWQNESQLFLIMGKSNSLHKQELIDMAQSVTLLE